MTVMHKVQGFATATVYRVQALVVLPVVLPLLLPSRLQEDNTRHCNIRKRGIGVLSFACTDCRLNG